MKQADMKKCAANHERAVIASHQLPEVVQPCETALDLPAFARALPPVLKPLSFRLSCVRKNSSQQSVIASLVRTHPSRRAPARLHSSGVEFGHSSEERRVGEACRVGTR